MWLGGRRKLFLWCVLPADWQLDADRHFVIENPLSSGAWKTPSLLALRRDPRTREVPIDMCRFDLRGPSGLRHKKPTRILTSSQSVVSALLGSRCTRRHAREPTMGGSAITTAAGHYTRKFAEKLVIAFEAEFDFETAMADREVKVSECFEVVGGHSAVDFYHGASRGRGRLRFRLGRGPWRALQGRGHGSSALGCSVCMRRQGIDPQNAWLGHCFFQVRLRQRCRRLASFVAMYAKSGKLPKAVALQAYLLPVQLASRSAWTS